jgi:hypothetical protein
LGGKEVIWKATGIVAVGVIVCETADGIKLGTFNQVSWYKEAGTIDLTKDMRLSQELVDELIVVGVAVSQQRVYQSAIMIGTATAVLTVV